MSTTLVNPFLALRKSRGLTKRDFARALGVSPALVAAVERGDVRCSTAILQALAALGFDIEALQTAYDRWLTMTEQVAAEQARAKLVNGGAHAER